MFYQHFSHSFIHIKLNIQSTQTKAHWAINLSISHLVIAAIVDVLDPNNKK